MHDHHSGFEQECAVINLKKEKNTVAYNLNQQFVQNQYVLVLRERFKIINYRFGRLLEPEGSARPTKN